ncbi:MAG: DUF6691 family protein [Kofleriaceae bacterium]
MNRIFAALSGVLFGTGLVISGMTIPGRVTAFLDVGGAWDPTLALVMAAAIATFAPFAWHARTARRPLFESKFQVPTSRAIDGRLLGGAAIFGVGWGLSGYCPGPAIVSLPSGTAALGFVAAMAAGIVLARLTLPSPDGS